MKIVASIVLSAVLISACSGEKEKIYLRTEKGKSEIKSHVVPNTMLSMEIEGMTCEMGCGGSIRKELKSTGAVKRVQFDFIDGRKVQTANVSFDSKKVKPEDLLKIVRSMNDKQFRVKEYKLESMDDNSDSSDSSPSEKESESTVDVSESSFEMPNIIGLLKNLVVG